MEFVTRFEDAKRITVFVGYENKVISVQSFMDYDVNVKDDKIIIREGENEVAIYNYQTAEHIEDDPFTETWMVNCFGELRILVTIYR